MLPLSEIIDLLEIIVLLLFDLLNKRLEILITFQIIFLLIIPITNLEALLNLFIHLASLLGLPIIITLHWLHLLSCLQQDHH